MIASDSRRDGECGFDRDAQDPDPTDRDGDLTDSKRQCAGGQSDQQCADDTGAISKSHHPDVSAMKNGRAYTASTKIAQQNKPMPSVLRTSPRASMVVAPCA
ncbi:hypothetical protein IVB45_04685 [Bradyrhizobium sp. 4]|uniref:hypothetical protein n=1 Tax=unclassified Bradyrhizobium TaxID=2631580 RepID=UPI00205D8051|nr:hypothetical protein [Bradyrhizobium sp. 39]MCK1630261.1 hypothetical protein [Bradyrhizobium sp. 162]MCK1751366.1 hypothetical protein [Bradyrhizobium sp. 135]UPJ36283.1 hypothetical protein IVB45_04685 [Bradyrhizobium sp. 4]